MTLEQMSPYIKDDELLEVTPKSLRLKCILIQTIENVCQKQIKLIHKIEY